MPRLPSDALPTASCPGMVRRDARGWLEPSPSAASVKPAVRERTEDGGPDSII